MVEGGYDDIAQRIFGETKAQQLLLEYDDERAGSFEPLKHVPEDKTVVLGLATTKSGHLEDPADLIERIHAASRFFPLDQLALSPQCGFASSIVGNCLTPQEQQAKLRLVVETADRVWNGATS